MVTNERKVEKDDTLWNRLLIILIKLQMSIVNLQVRIHKVKIKTAENHGICFSLRLGRILSSLSSSIPNVANQEVEANTHVIIGCEQNVLVNNTRASLVIYEVQSDKKREIIGMVFIMLKNQQNQTQRYKVQQSTDPHSYIELSFSISALELKQKENQSMASRSSLAEIRQLHRALTRGHKKVSSDLSYEGQETKKTRLSPQDKERELKHRNSNKINHLKSEQCQPFSNDEDPSYVILLRKAEQELSKERERNVILTNLLVIEEEKNTESENFIKRIINCLQYPKQKDEGDILNGQIEVKQPMAPRDSKRQQYSSTNVETVMKQRDELYTISQELYNKTKSYKTENQQLYRNVKSLENEMKLCVREIEELREQNSDLKKQIFNLKDKKEGEQGSKVYQLKQENEKLKRQNVEIERKFKQSYRAIEEFKNDAWKAQEEVIKKDQQIALLKEDLELAKGQRPLQYSYENNSVENVGDDNKDSMKIAVQNFKLMSALLMKNNLERPGLLERLETKRQELRPNDQKALKAISLAKQGIEKLYRELVKQNRKTMPIVEMKKKVTEILNLVHL